jgi:hypothetical protein
MSDKLPYTLADVKPEQFNALVQKVEEIHRMLKERQPSVVPMASTSEQAMVLFASDPVKVPGFEPLPVIVMKGDTNGQ